MILPLKHNRPNGLSFLKIIIVIFVLVVVSLLLASFGVVKNAVSDSTSSTLQNGDKFFSFITVLPKWFVARNTLITEIEKLNREVESLNLSVIDLAVLSYENRRLREELGIKPEESFVRAGVLARPPQIAFDTLVVDKGSKEGLKVGDLVLASNRLLAGTIIEVGENSSIVSLNSDSGNSFTAFSSRTGEALEVKGVGGGNLSAKTLLDFDIKVGDSLVVSGSSNYMIAIVGVVEADSSGGTKNVLMSLPFNVATIQSVFVLQ